jgi:chitinase
MIAVYFQTWSSRWTSDPEQMDLVNIDKNVDVVYLAFADPSMKYSKGQYNFANTGIEFSQDFIVVKNAIALLKKRGVKVLISVGGGSYKFPNYDNALNVCSLAADLDVDGIDLDWEPSDNNYQQRSQFGPLIERYRQIWGGLLTAAVWSVGADDPSLGGFSGMNIDGLKSNGGNLNWINFMGYDAGAQYDFVKSFQNYRSIYSGTILLGIEVGVQGWGGYLTTEADIDRALQVVVKDGKAGIFVWSWQKDSKGTKTVADVISKSVDAFKTLPDQGGVDVRPWKVMICCPACKYNIKLDYF